jgi:hypothetical protein
MKLLSMAIGGGIALLATDLAADSAHCTRMVESEPVACNGLEFVAATEAEWVCFNPPVGQDTVEVQLHIRNCTSHGILFSVFDTFGIILKDAAGHVIKAEGGRDATLRVKPVFLDANGSYCLSRKAILQWKEAGSREFTYWDGTGSWCIYGPLAAGQYSLSFWCKSSQNPASSKKETSAVWHGGVETNPVSFRIVDP